MLEIGERSSKIVPDRAPKSQSAESAIGFGGRLQRRQVAGLRVLGSCSIPTAPTSFLIHFRGLAKTARQQKAALTAGQRRRASKTSRHGWQADQIIRWKWRDCNVRGLPCCSGLSVPKLFRNLFTISNRKSPLRLVACLGSEPEGNGFGRNDYNLPSTEAQG